MSILSSDPQVAGQGLFTESSTQQHTLGERMVCPDGRVFRYCKVGATALVPGKLYQAQAEVTNHQNLAPTAAVAVDSTSVTVTLGATAATANQYAGGWAIITTGAGVGCQYRIASHPAAAGGATLTLTLEDKIKVALVAASSKVDLVANPTSAVIVNPATASSTPAGVAVHAISAGYYGWLQVRGVAAVLADGAVTVGTVVAASNGVAGAIEPFTGVQAPIGIAVTGIADTEYGAVDLKLE